MNCQIEAAIDLLLLEFKSAMVDVCLHCWCGM
jgi:hypothetical protein